MAKKVKDFSKSLGSKNLSSLIPTGIEENRSADRRNRDTSTPKVPEKEASSPTQVTTFRVNRQKLEAIKAIAFWDRKKIQDVFDEALALYLDSIPPTSLSKAVEEFEKRK